jgi:hypothetical protein
MAVAAATLVGLGAAFALGAFEGSDFGANDSYTGNCQQFARKQQEDVHLGQRTVEGIIEVGFNPGPTAPEAIDLLKTVGTNYWVQLPFRDFAIVCLRPGHEQEWIDRMKTYDWVEFAHKQGIDPSKAIN